MDAFHDPNDANRIVGYLMNIADTAHYYGVGIEAGWTNQISDKLVITRSTYIGNPDRFSQGFHSTTSQSIYYSDSYIDFISAMLGSIYNVVYEDTYDTYETLTELLAIPSKNEVEKYGPVIITLDWDVSLVDPSESKPIHKYYNIVEGSRGAYALLINHACTHIIRNYSYAAVGTFAAYANQGVGEANIQKWLATNGAVYSTDLMESIRATEERLGILSHIVSKLHRQIWSNIDPKTLTIAMARGVNESDVHKHMMVMQNVYRFNRLKTLCTNFGGTRVINALISTKNTTYNIQGPMTTVTSVETSLNEAGGTSQMRSSSQSVVSENILRWATPLKRNIIWPTGPYLSNAVSDDTTVYSKIQVPTSNWDDIKRIYETAPNFITQASKSYTFVADTLYNAVDAFYASVKQLGIRTASMSYDSLKGRGTYDVSYMRCH